MLLDQLEKGEEFNIEDLSPIELDFRIISHQAQNFLAIDNKIRQFVLDSQPEVKSQLEIVKILLVIVDWLQAKDQMFYDFFECYFSNLINLLQSL